MQAMMPLTSNFGNGYDFDFGGGKHSAFDSGGQVQDGAASAALEFYVGGAIQKV